MNFKFFSTMLTATALLTTLPAYAGTNLLEDEKSIVPYNSQGKQLALNNILTVYDADFAKEQIAKNTMKEEAVETQSWSSWGWNGLQTVASKTTSAVSSAASFTAEKIGDVAYGGIKYGMAANLNYAMIPVLEEVTAIGVGLCSGAAATILAGPGAAIPTAKAMYGTTKSALWVAGWVAPWVTGAMAAAYAPITKTLIIEPIMEKGPAIAKSVAGYVYNAASTAYTNYMTPQTLALVA
jgi:hypothetical protein